MRRQIMYGPIQFVAVGFEEEDVIPGLIYELDLVREVGIMRLIDFLFVAKDEDGDMLVLDVSDYTREERIEFGAAVGALLGYGAAGEEGAEMGATLGALSVAENDFGLLQEDVVEVLEDIPPGTSACLILFEHTWAKRLKQYMVDKGGFLMAQGMLHPMSLMEIGFELGEAVRAEEEREREEMMAEQAEEQKKKGTSTKKTTGKKKTTKKKPKTRKPKTKKKTAKK